MITTGKYYAIHNNEKCLNYTSYLELVQNTYFRRSFRTGLMYSIPVFAYDTVYLFVELNINIFSIDNGLNIEEYLL